MQDRLEKEKVFHNEAFATGIRKPLDAYYSIFGRIRHEFQRRLDIYASGKDLLECGCGVNSYAYGLASKVNSIYGIDISDEAVHQSTERARQLGLSNCQFAIMNAEAPAFDKDTFDLLFGVGIIHHLDLPVFFGEAARVLKPDGRMMFMEPLGYNPFLNAYRKMTPRLRTPDEHPLLRRDLLLVEKYFKEVVVSYYHFFTLLAVPFRRMWLFKPMLRLLEIFDDFSFRYIPGFKYLAWYTIIEARMPKDGQ